jgi:hypothetical protein
MGIDASKYSDIRVSAGNQLKAPQHGAIHILTLNYAKWCYFIVWQFRQEHELTDALIHQN